MFCLFCFGGFSAIAWKEQWKNPDCESKAFVAANSSIQTDVKHSIGFVAPANLSGSNHSFYCLQSFVPCNTNPFIEHPTQELSRRGCPQATNLQSLLIRKATFWLFTIFDFPFLNLGLQHLLEKICRILMK